MSQITPPDGVALQPATPPQRSDAPPVRLRFRQYPESLSRLLSQVESGRSEVE
jgi:hypothetical protein